MRKFAKAAILIPLAIVILVFALSNRQTVVFSLDPLAGADPTSPLVFAMPLFALAIVLVIVGVVIGSIATWIRQGRWRRIARQLESEARVLRADNDRWKRAAETRMIAPVTPPLAALPPDGARAPFHAE